MEISLTPIETPPVKEQIIKLADKEIGIVKTVVDSTTYKYHSVLHSNCGYNVYQGFGMTIDEALRNAFIRGRDIRRRELAELDNLENAIWGDHELN